MDTWVWGSGLPCWGCLTQHSVGQGCDIPDIAHILWPRMEAEEGSGCFWIDSARNPLDAGRGNSYSQHQGKSILQIREQVPVHQGKQNQALFIGLKIEEGSKINLKTLQEAGIMKTKVDWCTGWHTLALGKSSGSHFQKSWSLLEESTKQETLLKGSSQTKWQCGRNYNH